MSGKVMNLYMHDPEFLCTVAKALSIPERVAILKLIYKKQHLMIKEIAEELGLPVSTTALHINILKKAKLILIEEKPGTRGVMKLCSMRTETIHMYLNHRRDPEEEYSVNRLDIPVGMITDADIQIPCGMGNNTGMMGVEDEITWFYSPERVNASIVWAAGGFLEYKVSNALPVGAVALSVTFSLEICSEAAGFDENWKSDISFIVNEKDCGTWRSPGDMGGRRGKMCPPDTKWPMQSTQYGFMVNIEINDKGSFINGNLCSDTTVSELNMENSPFVEFKVGNKPDAKYVGGFNIFGKGFGDYDQDIVMLIKY